MVPECIIRKNIKKIGKTICLIDGDWTSVPFKACISHLWRKKSSSFEPGATEIGSVRNDYYLYIGDANHDITALSENAVVEFNNERYEFKHRDAVFVDDEVIYYTAILRKIYEGYDDEA